MLLENHNSLKKKRKEKQAGKKKTQTYFHTLPSPLAIKKITLYQEESWITWNFTDFHYDIRK